MKKNQKILLLTVSAFLVTSGFYLKAGGRGDFQEEGFVAGLATASPAEEIKKEYPNLPLYPEANFVSYINNETGLFLSLETASDPAAVNDYYQQELGRLGWQGRGESFFKGDESLSIKTLGTNNSGPTVILLNYSLAPTK